MSTVAPPPAELPPPPPPPFKNRRGWLTAFGIFEILIGCLIVLFMAFTVFTLKTAPSNPNAPAPEPRAIAIMAVFYVVIAFVFVIIGIGSIHARRWARMAMLIIAWMWLGIGIITALVMAFVFPMIMSKAQKQAVTPMPEGANTIVAIVMFVFIGALFIVLPLIFILFYSSKNVRLTCENTSPAAVPSKPVPVWIASGWFALGALGYIFVVMKPGFPLLGMMLTGWQAIAAAAVMEVFTVWLAWNLYQQRAVAWKAAVAFLLFGWVSTIATVLRMGFLGMYRAMGYTEVELTKIMPFVRYGLIGGAVFGAGFLIFLLLTRKYFADEPVMQAS